jgi:hypothetical protein
VSYGESSGRRGIVPLSPGIRCVAVAMMDQTRGEHALQSNAVDVRIIFYGTTASGAKRSFRKRTGSSCAGLCTQI